MTCCVGDTFYLFSHVLLALSYVYDCVGDTFYLIKEGTVRCTQHKNGRDIELLQLHAVSP